MKKVFSFSIGVIFATVVLCFSATPFLSFAMADSGDSHCGSAHQQSKDPAPKTCQHDVKTQAQFQQQSEPFQATALNLAFHLENHLYLCPTKETQENLLSLFSNGPPESHNLSVTKVVKTVVLRF